MKLASTVFFIHRTRGTEERLGSEITIFNDRPGMLGFETSHGEYAAHYLRVVDLERAIAEARRLAREGA